MCVSLVLRTNANSTKDHFRGLCMCVSASCIRESLERQNTGRKRTCEWSLGESPSTCLALDSCFSSDPTEVPGPVCHRGEITPGRHWGGKGVRVHPSPRERDDAKQRGRYSLPSKTIAIPRRIKQRMSGREERLNPGMRIVLSA